MPKRKGFPTPSNSQGSWILLCKQLSVLTPLQIMSCRAPVVLTQPWAGGEGPWTSAGKLRISVLVPHRQHWPHHQKISASTASSLTPLPSFEKGRKRDLHPEFPMAQWFGWSRTEETWLHVHVGELIWSSALPRHPL